MKLLEEDIEKSGTDREKLIFDLLKLNEYTSQPDRPGKIPRNLSLEEFQQFRSRVEAVSDEELAQEAQQHEEEHKRESEREIEELRKEYGQWPISLAFGQPSLPDRLFEDLPRNWSRPKTV